MKTFQRCLIGWAMMLAVLPAAAQSTLPLQVDLDQAAFAYDDATSLLEIYLAFGADTLPFQAVDGGFAAYLPLDLALVRSTETTPDGLPPAPVWADSLTLSFVLPDTSALIPGQQFVHQVRTAVAPGEYELHIEIPADAQTGRRSLQLQRDVLVPDFSQAERVSLSDITLASAIGQSENRQDPFFKNGLVIRPNPNQLYGQAVDQLYYYAEAYHTEAVADADGQYTTLVYVSEANRPQPLPGLQQRTRRDVQSPDVLVGTFDLSALPSGAYFLRLALLDEANEAAVEQSRKFFIYNPGIARAEPEAVEVSFETSPYAAMVPEEVEKGLQHIDLIATDMERRRARNLSELDDQRRFLMEFWQTRDPNPNTIVNEFRDEFYSRLQYANQRYSNRFREGWEADRGRVLIKYGSPAQVEPHLYDRDAKPYEIWQYNNIPGEGQAIFVFADRNGFGDFELLHSTVAGERKMDDWMLEIRR